MNTNNTQVVTVKGGYAPNTVKVRAGSPVTLTFDRQETSGCSAELLIPAFGIKETLPAFGQKTVEFTPTQPGEYEFTCGMRMLRGTLLVEAA